MKDNEVVSDRRANPVDVTRPEVMWERGDGGVNEGQTEIRNVMVTKTETYFGRGKIKGIRS